MVRPLAAALVLAAAPAFAQTPVAGPFGSPGSVVGRSSSVSPAGQKLPNAAPPAGTPIGFTGPGGMPVQSARPPGKVIDLSNLAAPLTAPLAPDLAGPQQDKTMLQKVYDQWANLIGLSKPPAATVPNYTPGISRRNRERNKFTWWRD